MAITAKLTVLPVLNRMAYAGIGHGGTGDGGSRAATATLIGTESTIHFAQGGSGGAGAIAG